MIKKIKVRNFYSIGEEQELSFEINAREVLDDSSQQLYDRSYINLVSCIVGANASGKTSFLKAFSFLFWFINHAYASLKDNKELPFDSHKLLEGETTFIEVDFYEGDVLYRYAIEFDKKRVLKEQLQRRVQRFAPVFSLEREEENVKIDGKIKLNEHDLDRFKKRPNVPLLSALIDLKYLPYEIKFFDKTVGNVTQIGNHHPDPIENCLNVSNALYEDAQLRDLVLEISKEIDLGISNFEFREVTFRQKENPDKEGKSQILKCVHTSSKGSFTLPIFEESNGTQRSYQILIEILPILAHGGVVVLDEIEDGLHPHVAQKIISLFESRGTNQHGAQLLFTTHQHILLKDRTKTQIFIAEKNPISLETELYRLDEIDGVRNDENYFSKYVAGAYGGTPDIKWA